MSWRPIAFVQPPAERPAWLHTHCQLPVAMPVGDDRVRVFFASRTREQQSHVAWVELAIRRDDVAVAAWADAPVLAPGPAGHFDEHGVYPSSLVRIDGGWRMYFIGWNQGAEPPMFYAAIGVAESVDGLTFTRISPAPVMQRSSHDPCMVTSPHVIHDGGLWRMYYVSGFRWTRDGTSGRLQSWYDIKFAESDDGIAWRRTGHVAVGLGAGETNVARPSVLRLPDGKYGMWYCYVGPETRAYRIGYAESDDGIEWRRLVGAVDLGAGGLHAGSMVCYPHVFETGGHRYMLYNGDAYGRDGFAVAIWE